MSAETFKIWKNPGKADEPPVYMGEFRPPEGQVGFIARDLVDLGFSEGCYTIRVPKSVRDLYIMPPWQRIELP
jgi:hypothetical protein